MIDFWKAIAEFDPRTADPHFCWALLRMEEQRYIRIKKGKIVPTGKVTDISPQAILDRPAPLWECNLSKATLVMESDGLLTIADGKLRLTEEGKLRYCSLPDAEQAVHEATGPETTSEETTAPPEKPVAEAQPCDGVDIEISDDVYEHIVEHQQAGETLSDTILRLLREAKGNTDGG
jgi:hypothetical protein